MMSGRVLERMGMRDDGGGEVGNDDDDDDEREEEEEEDVILCFGLLCVEEYGQSGVRIFKSLCLRSELLS
jgi:hypothetical protein